MFIEATTPLTTIAFAINPEPPPPTIPKEAEEYPNPPSTTGIDIIRPSELTTGEPSTAATKGVLFGFKTTSKDGLYAVP